MILTVDIGNSRIKLAQWHSGVIVAHNLSVYHGEKLTDIFDTLFVEMEKPSEIYAVCVAGREKSTAFVDWVNRHWRQTVRFMKTEKQYKNIINGYPDPAQHGPDRWACVVAASELFPDAPICVISAGTAITFDLMQADGKHLGGYILPSYVSMHRALLAGTANIASVASERFVANRKIPDNTDAAVNAGLHKLLQAGVCEICSTAKIVLGETMKIVITGGSAQAIMAYPQIPAMSYQPDLVMQGLYKIMARPSDSEAVI